MALRIGIDIGSTTVKVVVLDESDHTLFQSYERHFSKTRECACETLHSIEYLLQGQEVKLLITGSAGLGLAKASGVDFVQEVYATAAAVRRFIPNTDAVIELGGEDAKIIFFGKSLEERMNGSCAGGTGAFIDQMATLLNVTTTELDALSLKHEKIYPIASRCGVFAKSDIQPILNQGGRHEDIAASIFQAVVDQTVGGLTQGRELSGKIVFLGGPLHFIHGLRDRFVKTLDLNEETAIFPENGACFAGLGAALCAADFPSRSFDAVLSELEAASDHTESVDVLPPLFASQEDFAAFQERHRAVDIPTRTLSTYEGPAYLGIDAGSTTTKMVLITPEGELLYQYYRSNRGNPVSVVHEQLCYLREHCPKSLHICGCAVTGYGEDLIKSAFSCDLGLVETVAHYTAARHFNPAVDFIIDIGGQDMKCFKIRNDAVDSILLNEACSSGCGSFIETFARALGHDIADFSKLGLFAKHPVSLGSRCTVFMNSSVKQAQKDGASVADISAGLSISVVKNAVYKVIRATSADDLGENIVVQGGTFLNDAVLRAFEMELGREVVRPTISGLMGAFGAALAARDLKLAESTLLRGVSLDAFVHSAKPSSCKLCSNHCALTINRFEGERRFISGNRCSRPLGEALKSHPDLFGYKYERLRALEGKGEGTGERGVIGLPWGLNMMENLPFWHAFLTKLNFEVRLSPPSSRDLYLSGQRSIPSDTVCYPAKLLHGHIEALVAAGVDAIFYPCMSYNFDEKAGDNHYNCPVVAYYPELLSANVSSLQKTRFLAPYFGLHRPRDFEKRAAQFFGTEFSIPAKEVRSAARVAYAAYEAYKSELRQKGREYIAYARAHKLPILVLAGRPYHIDPEINHGINKLITSFDFVLITEDAISSRLTKAPRRVLNQWTYQSRMYNAARFLCTQPDMQMIQLVSFGCGIDSITTDELRDILESHGKLYTQLKIDDISNLGAVKIRIRSLIAALDARA